ncbi:chlorophyllase-2 [Pyrus ussuriensis x Pyrus communis]|uniref:Chlorophyllase-2 n=1 Tax=Pyrus ussuriensis x Pyrus communis TaxID=2448454 RepID=A0A5N5HQ80_9ROSA|nr:chlorophyllase-2 [Pyrus ussuriensis x Pyrus communis]
MTVTSSSTSSSSIARSGTNVFEIGKYYVVLQIVEAAERNACSSKTKSSSSSIPPPKNPPPPKPLLIGMPCEATGKLPMLLLLHGYLLSNSFYSQLINHIASHGFIVIAPQLYTIVGPNSSDEIKSTAAIINWLSEGLYTSLKFSTLIGIDPVDGMDTGKQTPPPMLTYVPQSFDLEMPVMVIGSGLGEVKRNILFPPCAPKGVNHEDFFNECWKLACYFVAKDYGHLDMLNDHTKEITGKATYCLCKNGNSRQPMRRFVGGVMVAFIKAYLEGDSSWL